MKQTLVMYFVDSEGGKSSITVDEPKFDLTGDEVKTAMASIIADGVILGSKRSTLIELHSAQIVERTVEAIDIE